MTLTALDHIYTVIGRWKLLYWLSVPMLLIAYLLGYDKGNTVKSNVVWIPINDSLPYVITKGNDEELLESGLYGYINEV